MAYAVADPYAQAVRNPSAIWSTVDAYSGTTPIDGAQGMRPRGGSVTDSVSAGRRLNLELAATPGLYDLLAPEGVTLKVFQHVQYTNRAVVSIPMGVFDVDSEKLSERAGSLTLTAPDRWVQLQRARFLFPTPSVTTPGWTVLNQIESMIQSAYGLSETVVITATAPGAFAQMSAMVWEKDRAKAIRDLADGAGLRVYPDRTGVWTIADAPLVGESADWLIDSGGSGVLVDLDRERSRANTYNVVVVSSSAADGASFPTTMVWDDDVNSPTYAGTNPLTAPSSAGPFGLVTYFFDTPLALDAAGARDTGLSILYRVSGLASQVSLGAVPNPAIDAGDAIDVFPKRERYDIPRTIERHLVETVTHPLTFGSTSAQQIEGRSTRYTEIIGGS